MIFIDESGIIAKQYPLQHQSREFYFVIALVQTDQFQVVKRVYKRAVKHLAKKFPSALSLEKEVKGANLMPFMKYYIVSQLLLLTDIRLSYIVVDNRLIKSRFRQNPARSFNYLTKMVLDYLPFSFVEQQKLELLIDNRNTKVKSINELEGYLYTELVLHNRKTDQVCVQYFDSRHHEGIQIADLFANIFFQYHRYRFNNFPHYSQQHLIKKKLPMHPQTPEAIYHLIKNSNRLQCEFFHPYEKKNKVSQRFDLLVQGEYGKF